MFSKNKKYIFAAIILVIALITVYFSAINRNNARGLDGIVGFVVEPVSNFFGFVSEKTAGFFEYFGNKKALMSENRALKEKVLSLEQEISALKSYEYENERLRKMLDFREQKPEFSTVAAKVVSKDNSNYYSAFLINKGTSDGVELNMPVVGSSGIIGYVIEAGKGFARIRTVLDGGSSVGCMITRTQGLAVTEGDTALLNDGLMKMNYVSRDMKLIKGDIIETSGMGQIYPPGIIIGRVEEIKEYSGSESQYAVIRPVENFETIHEVFVITDYERTGGAENE